jgi:putative ABC transport system substrate-binding protein
VPLVHPSPDYIPDGALMAWGTSNSDSYRRMARYVDLILKGAHPGDLPMEASREVRFVINLKTARTLGIAIPQSALAQATGVIQ